MARMKLWTKQQEHQLIANAQAQEGDPWPVVKLFTPDAGATWLLTEWHPEPDMAFGLCDLGLGQPEIGWLSMAELRQWRGKFGLPVERDRFFRATQPLSAYLKEARANGRVSV